MKETKYSALSVTQKADEGLKIAMPNSTMYLMIQPKSTQ